MIRRAVILGNLGRIILIIGISMLTCLAWSLAYHENVTKPILQSALITIACGMLLTVIFYKPAGINLKEGFLLVSLAWIVASFFGALPYIFSGYLPSFADAWFETVSGFTTTGGTVVGDVEAWPRGLLFWRSLTQWLGGMGIIVLFVAVIAGLGTSAKQLFRAEIPGGTISDGVSPRIRETARIFWISYIVLSIACTLALFAFGMDFFDALCHTFATMASGGFSTKNASIAFYASPLIQWTIIFFMFLAGTNFTLHIFAFKDRNPLVYLKNQEFKLYTAIIAVASILLFIALNKPWVNTGWEESLRTACFQVVSIVTTTGFSNADFNQWPAMASGLLFMLMFVGGCSGSTGCGIKPGRYLIAASRIIIELKKMVHPKAVLSLRFGGRLVTEDLLINVLQYFFLYFIFLFLGIFVLSMLGIDLFTSLAASAACLGNIGPGLGLVGPAQNFAFIPDSGKYVLSVLMLLGRLEIYPMLVLFLPAFWRD